MIYSTIKWQMRCKDVPQNIWNVFVAYIEHIPFPISSRMGVGLRTGTDLLLMPKMELTCGF